MRNEIKITDQTFLQYLDKLKNYKKFNLTRGFPYQFRLESAPNPTKRLQFNIVFFSERWKKEHVCPAKLAIESLDLFNSGLKQRKDYRNKTGQQSLSRRAGYLLPVLKEIERELKKKT